jgi:hypothetical protein
MHSIKKIFFVLLLCLGFSTLGYAQAAGKGSAEKGSDSKAKPRKQMRHFQKRKKDSHMKHNGTSYRRKKRSEYNVDGNGFSNSARRRRN